jgi:hypothetical protein
VSPAEPDWVGTGHQQEIPAARLTAVADRMDTAYAYAVKSQTHLWVVTLAHLATEGTLDAFDGATHSPLLDADTLLTRAGAAARSSARRRSSPPRAADAAQASRVAQRSAVSDELPRHLRLPVPPARVWLPRDRPPVRPHPHPTRRRGSTPVITSMLAASPPQASWWMLAPWLALGAAAAVVGLATSRKGPR